MKRYIAQDVYKTPDGWECQMVDYYKGEFVKVSELRELLEYQRKWNRTAKLYEKAKEDEWLLAELSSVDASSTKKGLEGERK